MTIFEAVILGIIEGITEFLPISSTGHMIIASSFMGLEQNQFQQTFEVVIQLGAILAVVLIYFEKLKTDFELWKKLIVAFIPTGILGLLFHKIIEEKLFNPVVVSISLIVWGIIFIVIEKMYKEKEHSIHRPEDISYIKSVFMGLFQSLAMVPGTSRSGATITGGLILGMDRVAATEFSFLLAIPTMGAATGLQLVKNYHTLNFENLTALIVGFITAFIFAYISVKWLLKFVKTHTFVPFGVYRIVLGCVVLALLALK